MNKVRNTLLASGKHVPVTRLCKWLGLAHSSAYYQPRQRRERPIDEAMAARIKRIHREEPACGAPHGGPDDTGPPRCPSNFARQIEVLIQALARVGLVAPDQSVVGDQGIHEPTGCVVEALSQNSHGPPLLRLADPLTREGLTVTRRKGKVPRVHPCDLEIKVPFRGNNSDLFFDRKYLALYYNIAIAIAISFMKI